MTTTDGTAYDDAGHTVYFINICSDSSIADAINEGAVCSLIGIPLDSSEYENTIGGTTNCVVFLRNAS